MGVGEICISLTISLQSTLCTICHYMSYDMMFLNHSFSLLAFAKTVSVSAIVKPTKLVINTSLSW